MINLLKWCYEMGVRHERRRVELLIERYRKDKPVPPTGTYADEAMSKSAHISYDRRLDVWHEVDETFKELMRPTIQTYRDVETRPLYED